MLGKKGQRVFGAIELMLCLGAESISCSCQPESLCCLCQTCPEKGCECQFYKRKRRRKKIGSKSASEQMGIRWLFHFEEKYVVSPVAGCSKWRRVVYRRNRLELLLWKVENICIVTAVGRPESEHIGLLCCWCYFMLSSIRKNCC